MASPLALLMGPIENARPPRYRGIPMAIPMTIPMGPSEHAQTP